MFIFHYYCHYTLLSFLVLLLCVVHCSDLEAAVVLASLVILRPSIVNGPSEIPAPIVNDAKHISAVAGPLVRLIHVLHGVIRASGLQHYDYRSNYSEQYGNGGSSKGAATRRGQSVSIALSALVLQALCALLHLDAIPAGCEPANTIIDW